MCGLQFPDDTFGVATQKVGLCVALGATGHGEYILKFLQVLHYGTVRARFGLRHPQLADQLYHLAYTVMGEVPSTGVVRAQHAEIIRD